MNVVGSNLNERESLYELFTSKKFISRMLIEDHIED